MDAAPSIDLFPARVTIGEQTYSRARVWLGGGKLRAFLEDSRGQITLLLEGDVVDAELPARRKDKLRVNLTSGESLEAVRAGGCGCGSALRGLSPSTWSGS